MIKKFALKNWKKTTMFLLARVHKLKKLMKWSESKNEYELITIKSLFIKQTTDRRQNIQGAEDDKARFSKRRVLIEACVSDGK